MKFVYKDMGHVIFLGRGYVDELVIENKKLFFEVVNDVANQIDGAYGKCVLSVDDKPVELSKYADLTVQFAPFELNRKSLITRLCSAIEQKALLAENYTKTSELIGDVERYILHLSEDLPFEVGCRKLGIGSIIKAVAPEIDEGGKTALEKIFAYMELVRELDRDRLFIMINMRTYFSDKEMEMFIESACLHGFKLLLIESVARARLTNTKRYTVDEDLCEF